MANWKRVKRLREWLLNRQNGICPYCDKPAEREDSKPTIHHRNHDYSYAKSGSDLVVCCEKCHSKINVVSDIFQSANDRLRQELMYQIQIEASSRLTRELSEAHPNGAIARVEDATIFSVEIVFKSNQGDL